MGSQKETAGRFFFLMILAAGCGQGLQQIKGKEAVPSSPRKAAADVLYGTDSRLDIYQSADSRLRGLADSTVALMRTENLKSTGDFKFEIRGRPYSSFYGGLCPSEKFLDQQSAAFCSGALVAPDVVLTAGHCVENESDCASTRFVFGFEVPGPGLQPKAAEASQVYSCSQILFRTEQDEGADYAYVKLDRAVTDHVPLAFSGKSDVKSGEELTVIGYPAGLPAKIAKGKVRDATPADYFVTDLDTYGGNSGSPVFDEEGLIEGVFVRGQKDFIKIGSCSISNPCQGGDCEGEDVSRVSVGLTSDGSPVLVKNDGRSESVLENAETVGRVGKNYSLSN